MSDVRPSSDPREILKKHGLWTKKRLGQNFLIDAYVPGRIVQAGAAGENDTVFEIGAGVGTLTQALAGVAKRVVALEYDRELVPVLRAEFALDERVEIREGNVLDMNWNELAKELGPLMIYGNLPYYLSSDIVLGLLEAPYAWTRACFLLQREFAERVAAAPGTRNCGVLSAWAALWTWPSIAFNVGPDSFYPAPKVESAVLTLERRPAPAVDIGDPKAFRQILKALFGQRRKMARKALKPLNFAKGDPWEITGLDGTRRGEDFSLEELAMLSRALS